MIRFVVLKKYWPLRSIYLRKTANVVTREIQALLAFQCTNSNPIMHIKYRRGCVITPRKRICIRFIAVKSAAFSQALFRTIPSFDFHPEPKCMSNLKTNCDKIEIFQKRSEISRTKTWAQHFFAIRIQFKCFNANAIYGHRIKTVIKCGTSCFDRPPMFIHCLRK